MAVFASGCVHLFPGLNVQEGDEGRRDFSQPVVASTAQPSRWPPYVTTRVPPLPTEVSADPAAANAAEARQRQYEVVKVTPAVVASLVDKEDRFRSANLRSLPSVTPGDVPPEYRIGPGDILFVTVWEHPELTQPFNSNQRKPELDGRVVAADGSVYYPYIGRFHVAGMTCPEAAAYIAKHLHRAVIDPKVDVSVMYYRAKRVQVTGEVKTPGTITLDDTPKGIIQAIDASGGLTETASRRRAVLVRDRTAYRIDLVGLLSGEAPSGNPVLMPGDEIHIPHRGEDKVYVLGEVNEQQPVMMQQPSMPLIEALASSGGMQRLRANDSGVLVFRLNDPAADVVASIYALDMSTPEGMLLASEFPLEARDIVYVKATAFAQYNSIIEQILPSVQTAYMLHRITRN
ncbi:MAG TPA: polysaccharide biosynthesis/export family protein [Solimonas sp.]|nr:polysaccharide biosynthesis/export family protein [Solimonas sp.]